MFPITDIMGYKIYLYINFLIYVVYIAPSIILRNFEVLCFLQMHLNYLMFFCECEIYLLYLVILTFPLIAQVLNLTYCKTVFLGFK